MRFSVPTGSWRDCGNDWRQSPLFWLKLCGAIVGGSRLYGGVCIEASRAEFLYWPLARIPIARGYVNSMKDLPATQISIFWRVGAAIGPRPRPAFVKRNLAVIDALLVFPFFTQPFLASESFRPIRWRDCAHGLTGNGLATHLGTDIDGSQPGRNQGHCENLIRKKLHN